MTSARAGLRRTSRRSPLIAAIDVADLRLAVARAKSVARFCGLLKAGLALFVGHGPRAVTALRRAGRDVFLDLKLHDIPNTVFEAATAAAAVRPRLLTVHALGGAEMVSAAVEGCRAAGGRTAVLAVTVLTHHDEASLRRIGLRGAAPRSVLRLARLALGAGAAGLVCSPHEVARLRSEFGRRPLLVTPGVRPEGAGRGDQRRTATPEAAVAAGADFIVVGRPIFDAPSPADAAVAILRACQAARR